MQNGATMTESSRLAVLLAGSDDLPSRQLAEDLSLPVLEQVDSERAELYLCRDALGHLHVEDAVEGTRLQFDFSDPSFLYRLQRVQHEALVRAVRVRGEQKIHVIDATAGLGQDAFLLAGAGFRVTMIERSALVHAMLQDALQRAVEHELALLRDVASRIRLCRGDSVALLPELEPVDVVYLDPMFPERRKSARVRKHMYLLQRLLHAEAGEHEGLLAVARSRARRKVVVKRPRNAPPLDGERPTSRLEGRSNRFDIHAV